MSFPLVFSVQYQYSAREEGITVPVVLRTGQGEIDVLAKLDTGASHCVFERALADALDIRLESGDRQTFSTTTGRFVAYGHPVVIGALNIEFEAVVYFADDPGIRKNVLGRRGWLNRVRLALIDHDLLLFLSDYSASVET